MCKNCIAIVLKLLFYCNFYELWPMVPVTSMVKVTSGFIDIIFCKCLDFKNKTCFHHHAVRKKKLTNLFSSGVKSQ